MVTTYSLHFKWTVSRGRDTYGYNICTLLVDGNKVGQCNGGGYDMTGTSFAQWLEGAFQTELLTLMESKALSYSETYAPINGFYGAHLIIDKKKDGNVTKSISLDGGCGFDCMRKIASAIGITLQWNKESDRYKNHSFYTAIIENGK